MTVGTVALYPVTVRIALMEPELRPPVPLLEVLIQVWLAVGALLPLVSAAFAAWLTVQHLTQPAFEVERLIPDLTSGRLGRTLFAACLFRLRVPLSLYIAFIPTISIVAVIENISHPYMALLNPAGHVFRNALLYGAGLVWPAALVVFGVALGILNAVLTRNAPLAGGLAWAALISPPLLCVGLPFFWLNATSTLENDTPALPFFMALGGVFAIYLMPFVLTPLLLHQAERHLRIRL